MHVDGFTGWIAGGALLCSLACGGSNGAQDAPPVIHSFRAETPSVEMGTDVLLTARFSGGVATLEPGGETLGDSGTIQVKPRATTEYILTVRGRSGHAVREICTVEVRPGLAISIEGHGGTAGEVTVEGPGGLRRQLNATGTLTGIPPGTYTITAAPAHREGVVFHPWRPVQRVEVRTGTRVLVRYPAPTLAVTLRGGLALEFVLVPAGSFSMGCDHPRDPRIFPNPSPAHPVSIGQAFYFAKYPTTQEQYEAVVGSNPSRSTWPMYNPTLRPTPKDPVDSVSFGTVVDTFLPRLNEQVPGHRFRLPSEAEWEYACRAGTSSTFFFGEDGSRMADYALTYVDHLTRNRAVGQRRPNPWGIHDLVGNVAQWCVDRPHDGYLGAPGDGSPWVEPPRLFHETDRIVRGAPLLINPGQMKEGNSHERFSVDECSAGELLGFRIVASEF